MIPSDLLLEAYRRGIFPMAMEDDEIGWFSPDPRAIIPLDQFHVPHGLKRALQKRNFEIRINHSFETVMLACASRDETWINSEIFESYCNLHRLGYAHSVEAWKDGVLAGGLYGVALGGAFFGESMFHAVTEASKVALHALVERMRERNFAMLDVQWLTPHLKQFGTREISRVQYLKQLDSSANLACQFA
ncbi:MAG: leucyl/phenylalanyl-tRNA--protein transferase [Verrucomicrobiota bacterium]